MPWKHVVVAGFIRVVFLLTCLSVVPAHAQDHLFGVDQRLDDVPGLVRVSASALDIDQSGKCGIYRVAYKKYECE